MSKKFKIWLAIFITISIASVTIWELKFRSVKPQADEAVIKQATIPMAQISTWEDSAGFKFNYPANLKVTEMETEDNSIYSSLELTSVNGEKLNLRISDTAFPNLGSWQKDFEKTNLVTLVREMLWEDIEARQLIYGAPKRIKTVGVDSGVIYILDSQQDSSNFWEKTQNMIINSFEFTASTNIQTQPSPTSVNENIVLLEEVIN